MSAKEKPTPNCLHTPLSLDDDETLVKDILKPLTYHTSDPAHSIKRHLLKLLGSWLQVPEDKIEKIDNIIHYLYNGTLLLDDLQDHSVLRRSKPTAPVVYGFIRTVLAYNWSHVHIMELLIDLDSWEVDRMFVDALPQLLGGQGLELYWRDNNVCPSEQDYFLMANLKVGQAFLLVAKVMSVYSTTKWTKFEKLLTTFGVYFQVHDDYQNLRDQVYFDQKGFAEDLSEGKFGFPLVHAINNFPKEGKIIQDILHQRTYDVEAKKRCLKLVEQCGSFEYTEKVLKELKDILFKEIDNIDDNPMLKSFLETAILAYL